MGSKTRLSSYCTKRANNGVNLVTSRKINTRLARPIVKFVPLSLMLRVQFHYHFKYGGFLTMHGIDIAFVLILKSVYINE